MIWRAAAVWLAILALANLNGAVRELWLIPRLGADPGRVLSTLALAALVFFVSWLTIAWIRPRTTRDALYVGVLWLVLTLAFEFLAGHYLFHQPWDVLLEEYDIRRGRLWIAVVLTVLFAPVGAMRLRGM